MILDIKANNCLIYRSGVLFSMRADMRYKRFPCNVADIGASHVLKTAALIGPNNSGKTNFVRIISTLKGIMIGNGSEPIANLFSGDPVVELSVSFLENGEEFLFEVRYDVTKNEYVYERFSRFMYDVHRNRKIVDVLIRDRSTEVYFSEDDGLSKAMKTASWNNILVYLIDTEKFPVLRDVKEKITSFAYEIDVVDMNNIPIRKTMDMLKASSDAQDRISKFVRNSDLYLDDFKYLNDDEIRIVLKNQNGEDAEPQEKALRSVASLTEMLHLVSVYKGIAVPSVLFDSTGTKKIAALASYVIDALEKGRILVVDELDNSLHFRLTRAIFALFNNELNEGAQLIATVHDVSLLDCQTLFRKEQIWFTHKDQENAYLYSLANFTAEKNGVRDTSDVIEKYRKGLFGALPEPDLFQSLLEVKRRA